MLLNSGLQQTVQVFLGDDAVPALSLTGQGIDNDNRGTKVLTSNQSGRVKVKIATAGVDCEKIWQQVPVPDSQNSYVGIVAAYNGADADKLFNDAYVVLTWKQPT